MSFCYNDYAEIPIVVVATTIGNDRLVLLNAETGEVITTRHLAEKKHPCGMTTDRRGNVYVCCATSFEVAVLTADLSQERILLTKRDCLDNIPFSIAHDKTKGHLNVLYLTSAMIDRFRLS